MKTIKITLFVLSLVAFSNIKAMNFSLGNNLNNNDSRDSLLDQIENNLKESEKTYYELMKILEEIKNSSKEYCEPVTMEGTKCYSDEALQTLVEVIRKNRKDDSEALVIKAIMLLSLRTILFNQIANNQFKKPIALNEFYLLYFWWFRGTSKKDLADSIKQLETLLKQSCDKLSNHLYLSDEQNKRLKILAQKAKTCDLYKYLTNQAKNLLQNNQTPQDRAANTDSQSCIAFA